MYSQLTVKNNHQFCPVQVRQQSLAETILRPQLPLPASLQRGCHSPSRLSRPARRAKLKARVSRHKTRPSSTPLCPLDTDTQVRKKQRLCLTVNVFIYLFVPFALQLHYTNLMFPFSTLITEITLS